MKLKLWKKLLRRAKKIISSSKNSDEIVPLMHPKEAKFIQKHLTPGTVMLEWGSGGSTLLFPKIVKEYHSIEHHEGWANRLKEKLELGPYQNVKYHFVPNNTPYERPSDWRTNPSYSGTPPEYFAEYINKIEELGVKFDNILIDGRCRVHCAIKALPFLKDDGVLFFHDFFPRKQYGYHDVLRYYDEVGSVKDTTHTVVGLRKKPEFCNSPQVKTIEQINVELKELHSES